MQFREELKAFLREQPFVALFVNVDLGEGEEAVLLLKSTADLIDGLRNAKAAVELGCVSELTESGPVICLVVRVGAPDVGELVGEVYLDPGDEEDQALLERLRSQEGLRAVFLDEDLGVTWLTRLTWGELQRLEVEQAQDRGTFWMERTDSADFERARAMFQEVWSLDRLLARLFPG